MISEPVEPTTRATRRWVAWLEKYWAEIGIAVFFGFFAIYVLLVFLSGRRPLSPMEQASMAAIGLLVSGVLGVLIGIPIANKRVRIASQLRRAYGIVQTLRNVQRDVDEASARMESRAILTDPKILNEFWKEIARNVHTALREPISEALRVVEDWGEMDRDERLRIETQEHRRTEEIRELNQQIQTAKSVEKDLEGVGENASAGLAETVAVLQQRVRDLQDARFERIPAPLAGSAKLAIDHGKYREAVDIYDAIILRHPRVHTNYVGRAKARYLAGDRPGALEDLRIARELFADDPVIARLESEIKQGMAVTVPLSSTALEEANAGNDALADGNVEGALRHFRRADELGWNPYFSRFNLAMVAYLGGDMAGARETLGQLTPEDDSYMATNKRALEAICAISEGRPVEEILDVFNSYVSERPFEYHRSPLRHLEAGLATLRHIWFPKVAPIFSILRSAHGKDAGTAKFDK